MWYHMHTLPWLGLSAPFWWSAWWAGVATSTVTRSVELMPKPCSARYRTPLLRLHVSTLKLTPKSKQPVTAATRQLTIV